MVPLDFDDAVLDRPASAAAPFQFAGKGPDSFITERDSDDNGNGLAATPLTFPPDPDNAVTCGLTALLGTDARFQCTCAFRADPAGFG